MCNKFDEFTVLINNFCFDFDVLMISETWYVDDNVFQLPMYETFFVNREGGRRGGGVSLLAHSAIKCEPLSPFTFTSDYCETCYLFLVATPYIR